MYKLCKHVREVGYLCCSDTMPSRNKHIPVNTLPAGISGIFIGRRKRNGVPDFEKVVRSHRDSGHSFILQEKGTTHIEIDFQEHVIKAPALIYIHPDQVHRVITFKNAVVTSWIITPENIHREYLKLLNELTPVNALALQAEALSVLTETASVCIRLSERKQEKLHGLILKESCNALVALAVSQYLAEARPVDKLSRFDLVNKAFKLVLEQWFTTVKSPAGYASHLNLSVPYLNECVKAITGFPVSWHIQQRVILEAKRLLYHTDKSVKEIAGELGYDDYSYFTRLFVKVTAMTPSQFRGKNHG